MHLPHQVRHPWPIPCVQYSWPIPCAYSGIVLAQCGSMNFHLFIA